MASIISPVFSFFELMKQTEDPRTQNWFMIGSPWPVLALLSVYLLFVNKIGPSIMAKRKPMNLDRIVQIYDVIQIILSSYIFYKALTLGWLKEYSYKCEPIDRSNSPKALEIAGEVFIFFIIKIIDLLDTIFFVLRKKNHQISFLHVYHHAGMVLISWGGVKYVPGGHITSIGLLNSFVHIIMYTHYLIASLKISKPWWKKYITQLQLIQFVLLFIHLSQVTFRDCDYPQWTILVLMPQIILFIVLFGDFYYKAYVKKPVETMASHNDQAKVMTSTEKSKSQ